MARDRRLRARHRRTKRVATEGPGPDMVRTRRHVSRTRRRTKVARRGSRWIGGEQRSTRRGIEIARARHRCSRGARWLIGRDAIGDHTTGAQRAPRSRDHALTLSVHAQEPQGQVDAACWRASSMRPLECRQGSASHASFPLASPADRHHKAVDRAPAATIVRRPSEPQLDRSGGPPGGQLACRFARMGTSRRAHFEGTSLDRGPEARNAEFASEVLTGPLEKTRLPPPCIGARPNRGRTQLPRSLKTESYARKALPA